MKLEYRSCGRWRVVRNEEAAVPRRGAESDAYVFSLFFLLSLSLSLSPPLISGTAAATTITAATETVLRAHRLVVQPASSPCRPLGARQLHKDKTSSNNNNNNNNSDSMLPRGTLHRCRLKTEAAAVTAVAVVGVELALGARGRLRRRERRSCC